MGRVYSWTRNIHLYLSHNPPSNIFSGKNLCDGIKKARKWHDDLPSFEILSKGIHKLGLTGSLR